MSLCFDGFSDKDLDGTAMAYITSEVHAVANQVKNNTLRRHDISRPCAICGKTGHSFDGCPDLKDNNNVRLAYIRLKLAVNRLCNSSETMLQPVNALGLMSTSDFESYTNQAALMQLNSIHCNRQQTSSNKNERSVFSRAIRAIQEAI